MSYLWLEFSFLENGKGEPKKTAMNDTDSEYLTNAASYECRRFDAKLIKISLNLFYSNLKPNLALASSLCRDQVGVEITHTKESIEELLDLICTI